MPKALNEKTVFSYSTLRNFRTKVHAQIEVSTHGSADPVRQGRVFSVGWVRQLCDVNLIRKGQGHRHCACKRCTLADLGGPLGPGAPLAPKISSKSCSFQVILREKTLF